MAEVFPEFGPCEKPSIYKGLPDVFIKLNALPPEPFPPATVVNTSVAV